MHMPLAKMKSQKGICFQYLAAVCMIDRTSSEGIHDNDSCQGKVYENLTVEGPTVLL